MTTLTVQQEVNELTVQQEVNELTVAASGPQGPEGPPGPAGGDVYVHTQSVAASTWIVTHNRGRRVGVTVLDDDNRVVLTDIEHGSLNTTTVTFSVPTTGTAVIS